MNDWLAGDVTANGIRLHYQRTGGHKPPLVLAHGIFDNGLGWRPLVMEMEADYDCILVDARGHGQSDMPQGDYSDLSHMADLADLIERLGLGQPALIGCSMGATVGALLAARYPAKVTCLVLEDPPWADEYTRKTPAENAAEAEAWQQAVLAEQDCTDEERIALFRQLGFVRAGMQPWDDFVGNISCPTLLVTGEVARGGIVSPAVARAVQQINPRVEISHIKNAGHGIHSENFADYVQAVRSFLRRVY
ncbi:MAG: alpha/beta fold hydrolase [Caldilineaceae bacterium]